jgi:hypothetical protein
MKTRTLLLTLLSCALLWVSAAIAEKKTAIESNEDGELTLTQPTKAGDLTLQPDTYMVKDHPSHGQHFIRFMRVRKSKDLRTTRAFTGWVMNTELTKAGDVKCRLQPVGTKAENTALTIATEDGMPRISQLTIKGKKAVYVF